LAAFFGRYLTADYLLEGFNACMRRCHGVECARWIEKCSERSSCFATRSLPHWTSLKSLADDDSGTGGVSIFALLLCVAAGIRPIITSSSDEKLKALQELYPEVRGINYKTVSDQGAEIKRLTDGRGVDFVINNTGPQSIIEDISFLCSRGGSVALVGFLHGLTADWQPGMIMSLMSKAAKVK
jgi:hypothetical protein